MSVNRCVGGHGKTCELRKGKTFGLGSLFCKIERGISIVVGACLQRCAHFQMGEPRTSDCH